MTGRDRGMTLIELVAAMAVFAVVAVMAVQALSGTLRARDRLTDLQEQTAEITRPVAVLRNDLAAAVPLPFYPPERGAPRSPTRMPVNGQVFEVSVAGQVALGSRGDLRTGAMGRVEWRFDAATGTLYRRTWRVLDPLDESAATPEVPMMTGVTGLSARSYWSDGLGWRAGVTGLSNGTQNFDGDTVSIANTFSTGLPDAVEVTVSTARYGDIRVLETLQ